MARPDLDGVTAFRTHELRPGWVPPIPRGRRCSTRPRDVLDRRLPLSSGQSLHPAPHPILRGFALRGINEGSSNSPVRSSPRPQRPGWNGRRFGFPLRLRTPPTRSRRRTSGAGTGHLSTDLEQRTTTSAEPPILRVHSFRATSRRTVHLESLTVAERVPSDARLRTESRIAHCRRRRESSPARHCPIAATGGRDLRSVCHEAEIRDDDG